MKRFDPFPCSLLSDRLSDWLLFHIALHQAGPLPLLHIKSSSLSKPSSNGIIFFDLGGVWCCHFHSFTKSMVLSYGLDLTWIFTCLITLLFSYYPLAFARFVFMDHSSFFICTPHHIFSAFVFLVTYHRIEGSSRQSSYPIHS